MDNARKFINYDAFSQHSWFPNMNICMFCQFKRALQNIKIGMKWTNEKLMRYNVELLSVSKVDEIDRMHFPVEQDTLPMF